MVCRAAFPDRLPDDLFGGTEQRRRHLSGDFSGGTAKAVHVDLQGVGGDVDVELRQRGRDLGPGPIALLFNNVVVQIRDPIEGAWSLRRRIKSI